MSERLYKKGDRVKVWSLQSWHHGGFLCGEPAVVKQDQQGSDRSVILAVVRNFDGVYKLDTSYEVYAKQCELEEEAVPEKCPSGYEKARKELEEFANNLPLTEKEREDILECVGKKVRFVKLNTIPYFQDFQWLKGIPSHISFSVDEYTQNGRYKLTAKEYGETSDYGNGAIYVEKQWVINNL